ncbi:MAG: SRPBCC family protein, partial [Pseudomonadota bacterium]
MVHVRKSIVLDVPAEEVWAVLRDFNGHDQWHPAIATSEIERGRSSDRVGCVRRFKLEDGSEL